jgi:hypothetical protein
MLDRIITRVRILPWCDNRRAEEGAMPQHPLQLLKLIEENATSQVEQLEVIMTLVESTHPARHLLELALHDARERQKASDAAWKAALKVLAEDDA